MSSGRPAADQDQLPESEVGAGRRLIAVLLMISAVNPIATNLFVPAIPDIGLDLGAGYETVQLAVSLYLVASAIPQLIIGPIADRIGRRPVVLGGLALFIVGCLFSALAPSVTILNIGRVIQGAGACAGMVLSRAIIRDLFGRERAASMLGYIMLGFGLAPMLSPFVGGLLSDHFGWRACFHFLAAVGAVALATSYFFLRETLQRPGSVGGPVLLWGTTTALLTSASFWAYALTGAFGNAVFFSFIAATPYASSFQFHLSGTEYGAYFIFVAAGFMLGNFVTGRYSRRFGISALIVFGNAVGLAGLLIMAGALAAGYLHPITLFGPMLAVNFGNGIVLPNSMVGAVSVRPEIAGTAAGLAGTLQIGLGAVSAFVVGAIISSFGIGLAFTVAALTFSLGAVLSAAWAQRLDRTQTKQS